MFFSDSFRLTISFKDKKGTAKASFHWVLDASSSALQYYCAGAAAALTFAKIVYDAYKKRQRDKKVIKYISDTLDKVPKLLEDYKAFWSETIDEKATKFGPSVNEQYSTAIDNLLAYATDIFVINRAIRCAETRKQKIAAKLSGTRDQGSWEATLLRGHVKSLVFALGLFETLRNVMLAMYPAHMKKFTTLNMSDPAEAKYAAVDFLLAEVEKIPLDAAVTDSLAEEQVQVMQEMSRLMYKIIKLSMGEILLRERGAQASQMRSIATQRDAARRRFNYLAKERCVIPINVEA